MQMALSVCLFVRQSCITLKCSSMFIHKPKHLKAAEQWPQQSKVITCSIQGISLEGRLWSCNDLVIPTQTALCKNSDREYEFNCKTVLIRKVTNFIEKNASRLVYTEHHSCSITWTSYYIPICWTWVHFGLPVKWHHIQSMGLFLV